MKIFHKKNHEEIENAVCNVYCEMNYEKNIFEICINVWKLVSLFYEN